MRKILFLLLLLPFAVQAQFSKGDVGLGGSLNFSESKSTQGNGMQKYTGIGVSPSALYFLNPRFALGGALSTAFSKSKSEFIDYYNTESTAKSLGIGAISRQYFPIADNFLIALQENVTFYRGYTNVKYSPDVENREDNYQLSVGITPVFIFLPSHNWGIDLSFAGLSYSYNRSLSDGDYSNSLGLYYQSISFGVTYYFRQ